MSAYQREGVSHSSYGSANLNGQLHPVIEAGSFFAARALGPIIRSNGYPSPATLPASVGGGAMGYTAAQNGPVWSWKLIAVLLLVGAVGVFIVHRASWR